MKRNRVILIELIVLTLAISGCASSILGINSSNNKKPISNPFAEYHPSTKSDPSQVMVLRTKKGDRSVELQIPGDSQNLSDFVLPVSPAFKSNDRSPTSIDPSLESIDDTYKDHAPSPSDHEITRTFSQGSAEDESRRNEIEKGLNLTPGEDDSSDTGTPSYLAHSDKIKQLYKSGRYEAALLETDEMIKRYQTDPKLFEMKGTLLDRMGQRDLAIKAWTQALRFNPKNQTLKNFINHKQLLSGAPG